ncbi:hypothetical protein B0H10DRAFT_1959018 [Mycena sp. CBHHK59/15]|nr:hypothetical protein B0H10DRAFT_1959018 [Mycena sp. CBHHK59/15]
MLLPYHLPITTFKYKDSEDDEELRFYCGRCDTCPMCGSNPKAEMDPPFPEQTAPSVAPRERILPATVPIALPFTIFVMEAYLQGGWRHLIIPYIIEIVVNRQSFLPSLLVGVVHRQVIPMAPKTYSCTSCPLVNGSTHKVLTSQRAQHNLELKAHRDREMEELAHTVSTLTLADGTQHDRQSHDMELLADMVTALALTDEGPNPSHQPSKLFSNRDEFQELHAPNIPAGFNPIPISEANASIASILRAPLSTPQPLLPTLSVPSPLPSQPTPRRAANRCVKRDEDLIAEIER